MELTAPRAIRSGDSVQLQITTAALPQGARLAVATEQGEILGAVTSFGQLPGQEFTTGVVPVPPWAIVGGRLRVTLEVVGPGQSRRPPKSGEVENLALILVPRAE